MTMGIFWLINFTRVTNLTISQIEHLVKLVNGLINKTTQFSQIGKCPS
jgi:hypothetical protein